MKELTLVDYHKKIYFKDLELLINSHESAKNIIPLISLSEGCNAQAFYGEIQNTFLKLENKDYFLTTHLFYILIDQARHWNSENKNQIYFHNTVPRLGGILSSYASNFHPAHLIYLASSYIEKENSKIFFEMFQELVKDMMPKYEKISSNNSNLKIENIFSTISNSTQDYKSSINRYFFKRKPNYQIVNECMNYLSTHSKEYLNK